MSGREPMKRLELGEFEDLAKEARILEQDRFGPKVLLTPQGKVLKLFRKKRRLTTATFNPYAQRFRKNSEQLNRFHVPSLHVEAVYRCPAIERDIVVYPLLVGTPLREYLRENPDEIGLLGGFAEFIAVLHYKSIYFRSLHLGNVLVQPDKSFALIDVADLQFKWIPMGPILRARNFRHLFRYRDDMPLFKRFGIKKFIGAYLLSSGVSPFTAKLILSRLTN